MLDIPFEFQQDWCNDSRFSEARLRITSIVFQSRFKHKKPFTSKLYANHDSTKYHDRLLFNGKRRTYQTDIIKSIKWTKGLMIRRIRHLSSIKRVSDMQQRKFPKEVIESFHGFIPYLVTKCSIWVSRLYYYEHTT